MLSPPNKSLEPVGLATFSLTSYAKSARLPSLRLAADELER